MCFENVYTSLCRWRVRLFTPCFVVFVTDEKSHSDVCSINGQSYNSVNIHNTWCCLSLPWLTVKVIFHLHHPTMLCENVYRQGSNMAPWSNKKTRAAAFSKQCCENLEWFDWCILKGYSFKCHIPNGHPAFFGGFVKTRVTSLGAINKRLKRWWEDLDGLQKLSV